VVAKNRQRLRRQGARRDVQHHGRQFASNLIQIRHHQQKSLRRGERGRQCAGLERAMNRSGRAAFALQFEDRRHCAPEISHTCRRPGVGPLTHRRRRRDGINGDDFVQGVSDAGHRFVGVERFKDFHLF
jgi:hypothetical protein